ncbi:MAG: Lrp/AsnC family transcriptional regulator [Parvularculaceae bacterium]|nr:Lrp/AsnC family transcriptional regulator [Parvularculaceae bacterium]
MTKFSEKAGLGLDDFDRQILGVVQRDNQLSHAEIGERVGLSGSAVRRRLIRLRAAGVIERDVSILASEAFGVTLVVSVAFARETPALYQAFEAQMIALPEVRQCYHIAGRADYLLVVQSPSLEYYEEWAKAQIMANDAIARYDTTVVWSCKKFETAVAL